MWIVVISEYAVLITYTSSTTKEHGKLAIRPQKHELIISQMVYFR